VERREKFFSDWKRQQAALGLAKVESDVYLGQYFITSQKNKYGETRYTIRRIEIDGEIVVFGSLSGFTTRVGAKRWLMGRQEW